MRYENLANESIKDWLGSKWSELTDPTVKSAKATARDTNESIAHNLGVLIRTALRYPDETGEPITLDTLEQVPLRAIHTFMHGPMGLDEDDIDWVIKNLPGVGQLKLPPDKLNSDLRLRDIFKAKGQPLTSDIAKALLKRFAQAATYRLYEKNRLKRVSKKPAQTAPATTTKAATGAPGVPVPVWQPGQPIPRKDGSFVMPDDANYPALARQYAGLMAQGIL